MPKRPRPSVNDAILLSLQRAAVPAVPPLVEAPATREAARAVTTVLPPPGVPPTGAELLGDADERAGGDRVRKGRGSRPGRRAPDQPQGEEGGVRATTSAFTLYPKDVRRIEDAITALRNAGVTEGNNRSAMVRMAVLQLPPEGPELVRLFQTLMADNS